MEKKDRIKELVEKLNEASRKYYQEDTEIMSNLEYDALYDELVSLEKETGIVMSNSPTIHVGYEIVSELPKEAHEHPMLSLDKTKSVEALTSWLGNQKGVISWKLDGLTVVLTYEHGTLVKAVTRGNGEVGEIITNNARVFANIPNSISYKGKLTIRGEAVITYSDFEKINSQIADTDAKYKNPRNLCSGSVRQLNNRITKERNVHFFAFNLVDGEDVDFKNSFCCQLDWLAEQGFDVVEHYLTDADTLPDYVAQFAGKIEKNDFPSDGLVLVLEDLAYGKSLGRTAKFPRDSMAFKWADEEALTHLKYVEWSPSRTGLINPVAVFEPVSLEGTTVSRASIHNVSILKALQLGIGDEIAVYKANMIIPQIARNNTKSGTVAIPDSCPACGGLTRIATEGDGTDLVETLYCTNEFCPAKKLKSFSHFVSRNAMNIDGLSEATIDKFIEQGFLDNLVDLYHLERYMLEIIKLDGFGEKSYTRLIQAVDASRHTTMNRFVNALGIPGVGEATAKLICRHFKNNLDAIMHADVDAYTDIDGIGAVIAQEIVRYFENPANCDMIDRLEKELEFETGEETIEQTLSGMTFVITGSLSHFENRDAMKEYIEQRGGKVAGSVSSKTSYLINNDVTSASSKNKKAQSLGIPILSEQQFLDMYD